MLPQLHDYQRYAVEFIKSRPYSGLFLDMGLGKTLITLTALSEMAYAGQISGHILIIAPKNIAINTWPDEIKKWDHTKNAKYQTLVPSVRVRDGGLSKKKRKELYKRLHDKSEPATIFLINRENITTLVNEFKNDWPFSVCVFDELQSFKSHSSSRVKAIKKVRSQMDMVIGLTGTPAPNSLLDLWAQIFILDDGLRLGPNISTYRRIYFDEGRRTPEGYPYEWNLKPGAETAIYNQIHDIIISMKAIDHLHMPPLTNNIIEIEMTSDERKIYQELKKEKVIALSDGSEIAAENAAVLAGRLLQLSNGAIYKDDTKTDIIQLHEHKLNALEQIVDSSQNEPLLVFYWYKHDLIRIKKRLPQAAIFDGSPHMKDKWNNGDYPIMLAQPSSAGHGLNLQDGGHIVVWFALPWSLELYKQGIARLFRQGQTKPVIVHHIMTKNTMDQRVLNALLDKDKTQDSLLAAVKAELSN